VRTIGAQLRPGASRALFGVSAASLADRHVSLEDLWGSDAARLRERLAGAGEPARQLAILQSCLVARLRTVRGLHPQIAQALAIIDGVDSHEHDREHDIDTIVRMSGLSHRRFIALFRDATGLSPKRYARVRRFGRLIGMLARDPARPWTDLALAAGYSDQPHCNREFREFAGVAPQTYRRAALTSPLHLPVATS
jgi:AraC-like DNA-binding protein